MQPLLEAAGSQVLLLSGDGGAGKTSLAFEIARWWLEGKPGGVVRLPVLIETALGPQETVADRVRSWLRNQLASPLPRGGECRDLEPTPLYREVCSSQATMNELLRHHPDLVD